MGAFRYGRDPIALFRNWFGQARRAGIENPNAMALATATTRAVPSVRYVLLQKFTPDRFPFFTNCRSPKSRDLLANPRAAAVFYWRELGKQVRIEGRIVRLSRKESEAYFATRPRESQLSAWASPQSRILSNSTDWSGRARLTGLLDRFRGKFQGAVVPCPPFWGGFALKPDRIEFWKSGLGRLHYRVCYVHRRNGWKVHELAP